MVTGYLTRAEVIKISGRIDRARKAHIAHWGDCEDSTWLFGTLSRLVREIDRLNNINDVMAKQIEALRPAGNFQSGKNND